MINARKFKSLLGKQDNFTLSGSGQNIKISDGWTEWSNYIHTPFNKPIYSNHVYFLWVKMEQPFGENIDVEGTFAMQNQDAGSIATSQENANINKQYFYMLFKPTSNANLGAFYKYFAEVHSTENVDKLLFLDLTELGLDTLTAQQFYNKYNSMFEDIAGNKLSAVKNIYASKFKSIVGDNFVSTGWWARNRVTMTLSNNVATCVSNSNSYNNVSFYHNYNAGSFVKGHKYFMSMTFMITSGNVKNIKLACHNETPTTINSPTLNEWHTINNVYTQTRENTETTNGMVFERGYNSTSDIGVNSDTMLVKNPILIDLTSLGLDNLTAEQFYNKYHNLFEDIASGKPNEVLFKYSGCNAKNMLGDMTNMEKYGGDSEVNVWYMTTNYQGAGYRSDDYFNIPISSSHKYFVCVRWLRFNQERKTKQNQIDIRNSSHGVFGNILSLKYNENDMYGILTPNSNDTLAYISTYSSTTYGGLPYKYDTDFAKSVILIDLTELGIDTLTPEQFYNKYHKVFDKMASGKTGEVFRTHDITLEGESIKMPSLLGKQDELVEDTTYERMPEYLNIANGVFIRRNRTTSSIIPYRFNITLDTTHTYFIGVMFNEAVNDLNMYNFDATNSTNTNVSNKITINNFICGTVTGVRKIDSIHFYTGATGGIPTTAKPLYAIYIDLTDIGLDTLTPQQFYDTYHNLFEKIASGSGILSLKAPFTAYSGKVVDLGSLNWTKLAETNLFQTYDLSSSSKIYEYNETPSAYCNRYVGKGIDEVSTTNKTFGFYSDNGNTLLRINDNSYNDANAFKTAMSGVKLIYESNDTPFKATEIKLWKRVDLGSLTWYYQEDWDGRTGYKRFFAYLPQQAKIITGADMPPMYCDFYNIVNANTFYNDNENMKIAYVGSGSDTYIELRNDNYNDTATFKTAMSGVYLYYETATPTELYGMKKASSLLGKQNNLVLEDLGYNNWLTFCKGTYAYYTVQTSPEKSFNQPIIANHEYMFVAKFNDTSYLDILGFSCSNDFNTLRDGEYIANNILCSKWHYNANATMNSYRINNNGSLQGITAEYFFFLDLTALGLDNLTAQQFYDLYKDKFEKLANGQSSYLLCNTYENINGRSNVVLGAVDLGTLSWEYAGANLFYVSLSGVKTTSDDELANIICGKYETSTRNDIGDKNVCISNTDIIIKDTAYTNATTFKNSLNSVILIYELATPRTDYYLSRTLPKNVVKIIDDNGMEVDIA